MDNWAIQNYKFWDIEEKQIYFANNGHLAHLCITLCSAQNLI